MHICIVHYALFYIFIAKLILLKIVKVLLHGVGFIRHSKLEFQITCMKGFSLYPRFYRILNSDQLLMIALMKPSHGKLRVLIIDKPYLLKLH